MNTKAKPFRRTGSFAALWLLCTLMWCGPLQAGTYVATKTLGLGNQMASLGPGDTLMVRAGVYQESLSLPRDGEAGRPIVLMAYPGERPVIQSSDQLLKINKKYWVIDGFILDHQNASSDAIKISSSAAFVTIRNCELRNGKRDGIDISGGARDITIENNVIHDFIWKPGRDAHGIVTSPGATRIRILNNTIYNCGGDAIQLYASNSDPISSYAKDILIKGNILYTTLGSNSENALDFKGVDGARVEYNEMYGFENKAVVVQKGCRNLTFVGNVIHDSQRGMEFRGEAGKSQINHRIYRNVVYNIRQYYAVKFDDVSNVEFVNNTIAFINATALRVEGGGVNGGRFQNNLFYKASKPSIKTTFKVELGYNGWFDTSAGSMAGTGDISGSDPGFVDAANYNFQLKANSPAIDAGADVGVAYTGSAPDIGAYEYGMVTSVQSVALSASVSSEGVVLRWQAGAQNDLLGFNVLRSRNGRDYQSLGFLRAGSRNSYRFIDRDVPPGTYYYRLQILKIDGRMQETPAIQVQVALPEGFLLEPGHPNPFSLSQSSSMQLAFVLPSRAPVQIRILNILGQEVQRLNLGSLTSGRHVVTWDARDWRGRRIAPGMYFYEVKAGGSSKIGRLMVLR
ncbi:MAG: right-handed parallel beta-helix repeat-containing protein [candidate division KSB1 bacterium]|nr:right-handed parallel beta-helix repeat-containing protein [candidate division KSB1 bacterium]MDQ7063882.1 right-handed parallel beta-helix repeat-containing protein [candidate division KSB1 bacterium]